MNGHVGNEHWATNSSPRSKMNSKYNGIFVEFDIIFISYHCDAALFQISFYVILMFSHTLIMLMANVGTSMVHQAYSLFFMCSVSVTNYLF